MKILTKEAKEAIEVLHLFKGIDALYWLEVLVKLGDITRAEAGYIIVNKLI